MHRDLICLIDLVNLKVKNRSRCILKKFSRSTKVQKVYLHTLNHRSLSWKLQCQNTSISSTPLCRRPVFGEIPIDFCEANNTFWLAAEQSAGGQSLLALWLLRLCINGTEDNIMDIIICYFHGQWIYSPWSIPSVFHSFWYWQYIDMSYGIYQKLNMHERLF